MAPGVAGALIATVIGLLVAIPAMFTYNFMVTTIRAITQELDGFASALRQPDRARHTWTIAPAGRGNHEALAGCIVSAADEENPA